MICVLLFLCPGIGNAQVGIGTSNPSPSAMLEVKSTSKGLLIPRLTTAQRDAISSPERGLIIYNSSLGFFQGYADPPAVDQENAITANSRFDSDLWQSFTVSSTGILEKISFDCLGYPWPSTTTFSMTVYSGSGTSGTVLAQALNVSFVPGVTIVDFSGSNIALTSGTTYTFRIQTGYAQQQWYYYSTGDRYTRGRLSVDNNLDMSFKVYSRVPSWVNLNL